jgi:hypothetical protein
MAKLPNAPNLEHLRGLAPSLISISTGTPVHRIYRPGGERPTLWNAFRYFGPTGVQRVSVAKTSSASLTFTNSDGRVTMAVYFSCPQPELQFAMHMQ